MLNKYEFLNLYDMQYKDIFNYEKYMVYYLGVYFLLLKHFKICIVFNQDPV